MEVTEDNEECQNKFLFKTVRASSCSQYTPSSFIPHMHTHIHTYTYTYTHIYTQHTHTHIHTAHTHVHLIHVYKDAQNTFSSIYRVRR